MSHEVIGGTCPNCGMTRICIIEEGITIPFYSAIPAHGTGNLIALTGLCCGCLGFLESHPWRRQDFEEADWFLMSEEKAEFIFGSRSPDEVRAEALGPPPGLSRMGDG